MKKKYATFLFAVVAALAIASVGLFLHKRSKVTADIDDEAVWNLRDRSPQMKVVITDDGVVGRFAGEDDTAYFADIQDTFSVDKAAASVEIWYACDGKGVVFLKDFGNADAYAEPSVGSETIGTLIYEEGCVPNTYPCLGYENGWFKIELEGDRNGYVNERFVEWDAIDSF